MTLEIQETKLAAQHDGISAAKAEEMKEKKAAEEKQKSIYQQALEHSTSTNVMDVRSDIKDELKSLYKEGKIDKATYKQAKKDAGIGFWRRNFYSKTASKNYADFKEQAQENKDALNDKAEKVFYSTTSDKSTKRAARKDRQAQIKSAYQNKAGQFEGLSEKEAKQLYDAAYKKTTRGTWLHQLAEGTGERKSKTENEVIVAGVTRVKRKTREAELTADPSKLSKSSRKTIKKLGLELNPETIEKLYKAGDEQFGTADATFNYSYHNDKRHTGQHNEPDGIRAALFDGKDLKVSDHKIRKLYRDLEYKVENPIVAGHVAGGMAKGAALGSVGFLGKQVQTVDIKGANLSDIDQKQVLGEITAPLGAAIGGIIAADKDRKRIEPRMAEVQIPENVKTYDDYAKLFTKNDEAKRTMLAIAKHYTNEADGTLYKTEMEKALRAAAGGQSVINYVEGASLRQQLDSGELKPERPEPKKEEKQQVVEEPPCEDKIISETDEEIDIDETSCHTINKGDNWYAVATAKYGAKGDDLKAIVRQLKDAYYEANKEELAAKGIKSSRASFFPTVYKYDENGKVVKDENGKPVHNELCLPTVIKIGDKEFEYQDNAVKAGKIARNSKSVTVRNNKNGFLQKGTKHTTVIQKCGEDQPTKVEKIVRK